jgi:hypothetical protein
MFAQNIGNHAVAHHVYGWLINKPKMDNYMDATLIIPMFLTVQKNAIFPITKLPYMVVVLHKSIYSAFPAGFSGKADQKHFLNLKTLNLK